MRQTPELRALLEAAITSLTSLLPASLPVRLVVDEEAGLTRLQLGGHSTFTLRGRPGWRGSLPVAGQLRTDEVLVVPYVTDAQAARLRMQGTCYLDRAGNAWLHNAAHQVAILVQGRPRPREARATAGTLLPGKAGLQLVAHLLTAPELVRASYRAIAAQAGLPVATTGRLLANLQAQGYVVDEKARWLTRLPELLARWVTAYGETLRPKLVAGTYRWLDAGVARRGWQQLSLPAGTRWGGEPAAHLLLDGYLLPQDFTLYSTAPRGELMRTLRLVPDPAGAVQVLVPPPGGELPGAARPDCVAPLLVYADLLLSGDPRNEEVARMLAGTYLPRAA